MRLVIYLCIILLVGSSSASPRQSSSSRGSSPLLRRCDGVPTAPIHRRACGLFIWDAPSALLYKWCHHLLKDHLIEGKGGHMYVRFESNSILQLLYPCSRYSPNKCLVCGGSYADHLELWWSKHLYTPFDRHLDEVYQSALALPEVTKPTKRQMRDPKGPIVTGPPNFSFHKRYVEDVSDIMNEEGDTKKKMEHLGKKYARSGKQLTGWTMQMLSQVKVIYILPPITPSFAHHLVRSIVLGAFNDFVYVQERENVKAKNNR